MRKQKFKKGTPKVESDKENIFSILKLHVYLSALLFMIVFISLTFVLVICWIYHYFYSLAELGDYDPVQHTPGFVSEFRFVPDQTEEMEIDILNFYKSCK